MEMPSFLREDGMSYVYNDKSGGTFKFYIPEKFFDRKLAIFDGELIILFGIINYARFDSNDKLIGKFTNFNFPAMFTTKPDIVEEMKGITLTKYDTEPQDYKVLVYHDGAPIVYDSMIPEDGANLEIWYSALLHGNIPNTIPYDELQEYFINNISLTGNKYNVSMQLMGVVLRELCVGIKDDRKIFRLTSDKDDMHAYQVTNIRETPRKVSPFNALISEVWKDAVINAITVENDKYSALEGIMMND